jgi:hypothetical protein
MNSKTCSYFMPHSTPIAGSSMNGTIWDSFYISVVPLKPTLCPNLFNWKQKKIFINGVDSGWDRILQDCDAANLSCVNLGFTNNQNIFGSMFCVLLNLPNGLEISCAGNITEW